MSDSILVTGGSGFIGRFLVECLHDNGLGPITVFDVSEGLLKNAEFMDEIVFLQGDIANWSEVLEAVAKSKPGIIFHLAGLRPPHTEERILLGFRINLEGTMNVLEASRINNVEKAVFTSTQAAYGVGVPTPITEDTFRDPYSFYGAMKVGSEIIGTNYRRQLGVDFRSVRFPG